MDLITTVCGADSNSYITLAEHETYITAHHASTLNDWNTLTTDQKNSRIALACKLLDSFQYKGQGACTTQALSFPRFIPALDVTYETTSDITDAGLTVPSIPDDIKYAQSETCVQIINTYMYGLEIGDFPERPIKQFSLGGALEITFSDALNKVSNSLWSKQKVSLADTIYLLLSKYLKRFHGGVV